MVKKGVRTSKFNNVKTVIDNISFSSKKESARYVQLKLDEKDGLIHDLKLQVPFQLIEPLVINNKRHRAIIYYADFTYYDPENNYIVEDVKGMITDIFKIKYRLMKMVHGIDINIT